MKTCFMVTPQETTKVYDFLLYYTPIHSTWIIKKDGWYQATFYIDDEDLWTSWFPKQHDDACVKSYSYDEITATGIIEYVEEAQQ